MKFLYYILLLTNLLGCKAQYITHSDLKSGFETYDLKDYDQRIKHGKIDTYEGNNYIEYRGTDIYIYPKHKYYRIVKEFYNNGNIKEKGLQFGSAKIGIWEYYDEQGKLVKTVNEDKKFSPKFNYNDIIDFIHKRGKINKYHKKKKFKIRGGFADKQWSTTVSYDTNKIIPRVGRVISIFHKYRFDYEGNLIEKREDVQVLEGGE